MATGRGFDRLVQWTREHPQLADAIFYVTMLLLMPFFQIGLMQVAKWLKQP